MGFSRFLRDWVFPAMVVVGLSGFPLGWVVTMEISVVMGLGLWILDSCLLVWLKVVRFFWISMGVGCGRGDRCDRGNRCGHGSSIVVLEFVFAGLVGGGWVFLDFRGVGWSVVEVEISVAMEIDVAVGLDFVFTSLGLNEFGFVSLVFIYLFIF